MLGAPSEAIGCPNKYNVEWMPRRLTQHFVKRRSPCFGPTDAVVYVFSDNFIASLFRKGSKFDTCRELHGSYLSLNEEIMLVEERCPAAGTLL
jgi:hypothetical protein